MYKVVTAILFVVIGVSSATRSFNTPSKNLQRLIPNVHTKDIGIDLCSTCIDESVTVINVLLQTILDEGIYGTCGDLCDIVANKTGSKFAGTVCDLACDAVGAVEFIHLIVKADLDPIWYCEIAHLCGSNKNKKKTTIYIYLVIFIYS